MNKCRLATLISAASVVVLSSTLFGSTLASWAVTDNAGEKNIKISTQSTLRTLTFYTTYDGSSWGTPVQRTVFDGDKIAVGDIPAATYSSTDYIFNGCQIILKESLIIFTLKCSNYWLTILISWE